MLNKTIINWNNYNFCFILWWKWHLGCQTDFSLVLVVTVEATQLCQSIRQRWFCLSNIIYDSAFYFYFLQWGHLAWHTFAINQDIEIDWIIEIQCNFKRHNKLSFYKLNIQVSKLLSRLVEKALLLLGQQSSTDSRVLSINSVSSVIIGPLKNKMKKE